MEVAALLIGLIALGIPAAVIYLLISNAGLLRRVDSLEKEIERFRATQSGLGQSAPTQQVSKKAPIQPGQSVKATPAASQGPLAVQRAKRTAQQAAAPPKAYVMTPDALARLIAWLTQNWFYAVSAVSLALAGVFLVQYGIEKGLLPPPLRVLAAIVFGLSLIGVGEYIRRRFGDDEGSSTAYLPSTFASAGIVTMFAAVLSARALYSLIGPETALIGLAAVGAGAMVLGWFYGPLLAAIGIVGAVATPFVVGGSSDDASWLFAYFAIVTVSGLAIDTMRQWAWVSVLSLVLGFGAATALIAAGPSGTSEAAFMVFCAGLAIAATAIPVRRLLPNHGGSRIFVRNWNVRDDAPWPEFPTRLAGGALLTATALVVFTLLDEVSQDLYWLGYGILVALVFAMLIWARRAHALADLACIPAAAMIAAVPLGTHIWDGQVSAWRGPDGTVPLAASCLVAIGLAVSVISAWRSLSGGSARLFFAILAALYAPALAIAMEVFWQPSSAFASYGWALHALIIAIFMVAIAERFHRADGQENRLRVSLAALSGLASIAFAMVILFSSAALTVAIAATVVGAAALDRKFDLPPMSAYIMAGVAGVMYRLSIDPGIAWAVDAPLAEMLLSHGGAVFAFAAAWSLMRGWDRLYAQVALDSAVFAALGIFLSLILYRAIVEWGGQSAVSSHWSIGIGATVWLCLGFAQWRRVVAGGLLTRVRQVLGSVFLVIALAGLFGGLLHANPLFSESDGAVIGPIILSSLIPAYLLPASLLALAPRWLTALPHKARRTFLALGAGLGVFWLGVTIRHFWRGTQGMRMPGMDEAELYSYTVALILLGAALMYRSLAQRSAAMRKAGLIVIALAVAKVFLIDISGLGGLTRVFSLLALGVSLAGLAWLNRWVAEKSGDPGGSEEKTANLQ